MRIVDLSAVLCPPYDVISAAEQQDLVDRHPRNAVRLELPPSPGAGGDDDQRYRSAAAALAAWRAEGTLRQEAQPTVYVHAMRYRGLDGADRQARGLMARLALEPLDPPGGVLPHERTMQGPKDDRYRLLAATGANLSPVVLVHDRPGTPELLDQLTGAEPAAEAVDDAGVAHRLWVVPATVDRAEMAQLLATIGRGPLTIADGHHRYETALRYRDECARARASAGLPPADTVMALVYATEEAPSVLAAHRLLRDAPRDLLARATRIFDSEPVDEASTVQALMARPKALGATARFGLWMRGGGAILRERSMTGRLDTTILAEALGVIAGIGEAELHSGGRVAYTKDPGEAVSMVQRSDGIAAFLLDPTPVEAVLRTSYAGGIMPPKSTYFHPKAPTGLVFDPLDA